MRSKILKFDTECPKRINTKSKFKTFNILDILEYDLNTVGKIIILAGLYRYLNSGHNFLPTFRFFPTIIFYTTPIDFRFSFLFRYI